MFMNHIYNLRRDDKKRERETVSERESERESGREREREREEREGERERRERERKWREKMVFLLLCVIVCCLIDIFSWNNYFHFYIFPVGYTLTLWGRELLWQHKYSHLSITYNEYTERNIFIIFFRISRKSWTTVSSVMHTGVCSRFKYLTTH